MLQGMNILYENNFLVHYYFPIVVFKQWGSGTANKNGASYGGVSATLPIKINNMLLCVGNMSGSAACLMNVGFNAEKNTISGGWDSFQYNTNNPSSWRYLVISI